MAIIRRIMLALTLLSLFIAAGAPATPAHAMTDVIVDLSDVVTFDPGDPETCNNAKFSLSLEYKGDTVDHTENSKDYDYFMVVIEDGYGNYISYIEGTAEVGQMETFGTQVTPLPPYYQGGLLTVTFYDTPGTSFYAGDTAQRIAWAKANGDVKGSDSVDPEAIVPDCDAYVQSLIDSGVIVPVCPVLPTNSVVGSMPNATRAYYRPGDLSTVILNPGTYWVIGVDETEMYYKVMLSCAFLWVPIESMQPSYQSPWQGQPLPTRVVS